MAHAQACDPAEIAKLLVDDGATRDGFGKSVSIEGDTAVVGSRYDDDNGYRSGSAYVFTRNGGVWSQQAKLLAADGKAGDAFGYSISLDGNTAVIGALEDDDNGASSGSAYVFTRNGGVWTQQAKLLPGDGARGDEFGSSVSLDGDTAVIGALEDDDNGTASGSAYVFTRSGGVWVQQAKLLPGDGETYDWFGRSVSIDGDTAFIGAPGDDNNETNSGSVYVFSRIGEVWTQQTKLLPGDEFEYGYFGQPISFSGDTAVIGAHGDDDNGDRAGSAYVFTRGGGAWSQQAKLLAGDGAESDYFGLSVSFSGDTAIIGAKFDDDNGHWSGSAYFFARSRGVWTQRAKLLTEDGSAYGQFGHSVSLSNGTAIIGANFDDDSNDAFGSAYIFDLNCDDCPADLTGDGLVNTGDFLAFLNAWASSDPLADWNEDGTVNTQDFIAYLTDWVAGCP